MILRNKIAILAAASIFTVYGITSAATVTAPRSVSVQRLVSRTIKPLMAKYSIPGMAVGVTVAGHSYVLNYGVASKETGAPVTDDTLFEIGSVTKTLTATLVSWAKVNGYLSLSDEVGDYLPSLRKSKFGSLTLMNLGTYTPGGVPLQVPGNIHNDRQLMDYLRSWKPIYPPGTHRTYSNLSIGVLGLATAKSLGQPFSTLMQGMLLPALGMNQTYLDVPDGKKVDYAQGYTKEGGPIRLVPGELGHEAYGLKSTASDLVRFVAENMRLIHLKPTLQRAVRDTHTGYFVAGQMTQDLVWEQVPYPIALRTLLAMNSSAMAYDAVPVNSIHPPQQPQQNVWINKTGSTNGFSAYVAFIPGKRIGLVLLANKNYPVGARVKTAYRIIMALVYGKGAASSSAQNPDNGV